MRPSTNPAAAWAGLFVLYLVWGSTYLAIRIAVGTIPPFILGMLRFVPAGLVLAGVVVLRQRGAIRRPSWRELRDTAIVGTMLMVGGMGMVAVGEQTVPSGVAALLIGLMPMWLAVFARVFVGDRLPVLVVVGIVIGVAGVAILAWPVGGAIALDPVGLGALILSPMFWSLGTLYAARRAVLPRPALFATGLEMIAGGLALGLAGLVTGEFATFDPAAVSTESWLGIGYLLVVGSLVGYTTFSWLVTVTPLPRLSTYAYVNPVVAVFLGWLVLGEPLSLRTGVAAVVIVVAVVLIVTARGRAERRASRVAGGASVVRMPATEPGRAHAGEPVAEPAGRA
jgi:drug/metabolite transporter (DMT)-like permease